jgi:hypothetical protein
MLNKKSFIYICLILFLGLTTVSCRRGSGCPANEQMQSMNQDPASLAASMQKKKKSKKAEPKSSVLPAEKKYVPRKKKH